MKKKIFVALLLAMLPWAAFAAGASVELRGISVSSGNGGMLVTLATSAPTTHRFFTLEGPDRVVVDLAGTRLASGVRLPKGEGIVATIRTGEQSRGTLRVVIELESAAASSGAWQPAFADVGNRFVVAVGTKAFVAAAGSKGAQAPAGAAAARAVADTSEKKSAAPKSPAGKKSPAAASPPKVVRAPHAPADGNRDIIIAVDAGHGGQDPGAIGRNGTREKDVVLAVSRALAARINAEPGMRAVLIRDSDHFIVLRDRQLRARAAKADLFVSIHADAIRDRNISGASVYVLSERGASSEAARWLAERENAADLMGGVKLDDKEQSLASVLLDLSQTASLSASMTAAELVLLSLDRAVEVRKPKVQQAGLIVLKSPDIPSMLVETAYISNPREEARLGTARHQQKLAEAIFKGLRSYFESSPPPGTLFAQMRRSQLAGVVPTSPAAP